VIRPENTLTTVLAIYSLTKKSAQYLVKHMLNFVIRHIGTTKRGEGHMQILLTDQSVLVEVQQIKSLQLDNRMSLKAHKSSICLTSANSLSLFSSIIIFFSLARASASSISFAASKHSSTTLGGAFGSYNV
jgi:hypothetical protein